MLEVALYMTGVVNGVRCVLGFMPCMLLCALLYAGGCGWLALFAGGVGNAGGDALCATLYARGCGGYALFMELLEVSEVLEVREMIRCVRTLYAGGYGGVGGAGDDTPCATLYAGGRGG